MGFNSAMLLTVVPQLFLQHFGDVSTDGFFQVFDGGCFDRVDGAVFFEQSPLDDQADAGDVVDFRGGELFAAEFLSQFVGEAVGFVADALDEVEGLRVAREEDAFRWEFGVRSWEKNFFFLLCQADDGDIQVGLFDHFSGDFQLAFAAVDDDEVGDLREGVVGGFFGDLVDEKYGTIETIGTIGIF